MKLATKKLGTATLAIALTALTALPALVAASPITFELPAGQRECFYTLTSDTDCTVSYYFAVQQGENNDFDIDYEVFAPDDAHTPVISRSRERQGEWSFVAVHKGEYSLCFYGGKAYDKIVDVELNHKCPTEDQRDARRQQKKAQRQTDSAQDHLHQSLSDSVDMIERQLSVLERNMQYYKTRNNRNQHTVASTESRIVWFSLYGILLIAGMGFAQVAILQMLFSESRKHVV